MGCNCLDYLPFGNMTVNNNIHRTINIGNGFGCCSNLGVWGYGFNSCRTPLISSCKDDLKNALFFAGGIALGTNIVPIFNNLIKPVFKGLYNITVKPLCKLFKNIFHKKDKTTNTEQTEQKPKDKSKTSSNIFKKIGNGLYNVTVKPISKLFKSIFHKKKKDKTE